MKEAYEGNTKPATYADIEALPPHVVGQILFGSLVTHPRPATRHATAAHRLGIELGAPFELARGGPGGWIFLPEEELHLGPHVVVPDLAGWRRERLPDTYGETAFLDIAPNWVCEILSPATARHDKGAKSRIYATYQVDHLWFVNPLERSLEVFARRDSDWVMHAYFADDEDVSAPPFADLTFSLGQLWPFTKPEGS